MQRGERKSMEPASASPINSLPGEDMEAERGLDSKLGKYGSAEELDWKVEEKRRRTRSATDVSITKS